MASQLRRFVVTGVVLCFMIAVAQPALARPTDPSVSPRSAHGKMSLGGNRSAPPGGTSFRVPQLPPPECNEWDPECVNEPADCTVNITKSISRGDNPEFGGTYSRVTYDASMFCYGSGYVWVTGRARLVDRTEGHDGTVLSYGSFISEPVEYPWAAHSRGGVDLYDVDWPRGKDVEVLFEFTAEQQFGEWAGCWGDSGDYRFHRCLGAGTPVLDVLFGYTFSSQLKRPWRYVALGDSYSSGLGAGNYYEGDAENGCAKSRVAYPRVIETTLRPALSGQGRSTFVVHPACAGAETRDVLNTQLGAFNGDAGSLTDWVTISIGGNDVGFGPMIRNCVENDCSNLTITDAQLAALETNLRAVYSRVRQLTPFARHMVVLYPQIVPATVGTVCPVGITQAEANAIRTAWERANNRIRTVALSEQWEVLDAMTNAFAGHSICDGDPYANGVVGLGGRESYHPNAAGNNRMAQLLIASGTIPM